MVYIIPVSHEVQARKPEDYPWAKDFQKYLKNKSLELKITFIAEEWSIDCSNDRGTNVSNVKQIADELGVDYKIIDPNKEERAKMGLPLPFSLKKKLFPGYGPLTTLSKEQGLILDQAEAGFFPKREGYWLKLIQNRLDENMILICGGNHTSIGNKHLKNVKGFDEKLKDKGYGVEILSQDFFLSTKDI